MRLNIAILPGDGIGVEVMAQAARVIHTMANRFGHQITLKEYPVGGAALEVSGSPLPEETLQGCLQSHAVLLGAVGLPRYDVNPPAPKPEAALVQLRLALGTYANLRPCVLHPTLIDGSPFRQEFVTGVDILIVRELTGGIYTSQPRGLESTPRGERAINTMAYDESEIRRIARVAFDLARTRRRKVTSVDKANMLEVSQLWRCVVTEVGQTYADVQLEHLLVDNCAMRLILRPGDFDVILTENLFGDILSEEVAALSGSLGLLPSASIGGKIHLYEPAHGSAPDIAGQGIANPIAAILSVALMFRYSFHLLPEAEEIEAAVSRVLKRGYRTADLLSPGVVIGTEQMGTLICEEIEKSQ